MLQGPCHHTCRILSGHLAGPGPALAPMTGLHKQARYCQHPPSRAAMMPPGLNCTSGASAVHDDDAPDALPNRVKAGQAKHQTSIVQVFNQVSVLHCMRKLWLCHACN